MAVKDSDERGDAASVERSGGGAAQCVVSLADVERRWIGYPISRFHTVRVTFPLLDPVIPPTRSNE